MKKVYCLISLMIISFMSVSFEVKATTIESQQLTQLLSDPSIIKHYGNLQSSYDSWIEKKQYGLTGSCIVSTEHVTIKITDQTGEIIYVYYDKFQIKGIHI
jgi:hypothetical protein